MSRLVSLFRDNPFLSGSALVLAGSFVVNALNYAFNLIIGRLLTPSEFSEVALLVTLFTLLTVPLGSLRILLTQRIASLSGTRSDRQILALVFLTRRVSRVVGILGAALFAACTPFIARFFDVSIVPLLLLSLTIPTSLAFSVSSSVAQGMQKFRSLSLSNVLATVVKLVGSVAFILLGLGSGGVILALVASSIGAHYFLLSTAHIRAILSDRGVRERHSEAPSSFRSRMRHIFSSVPRYFPIAFATTILMAVFGNIDIVLGKRILDAEASGILSAVAVLGRIITYGGGAIVTVLLPLSAASLSPESGALSDRTDQKPAGRSAHHLLFLSLAVVGGSGVACLLLFFFFPQEIVSALFGDRYLAAAPFLPSFGLAMLFGSLSSVFLYSFLAQLNRFFLLPYAVITLGFVISLFRINPSIESIVRAELIANVLLFGSFLAVFLFQNSGKVKRKKNMRQTAPCSTP